MKHRWTYFLRTIPDIVDLLEPLEKAISFVLYPAITEQACNENDRNIISLPLSHGGLGTTNPCTEACLEYSSSFKIISQSHEIPEENNIRSAKQEARSDREKAAKDQLRNVKDTLSKNHQEHWI